MSDDKHREAAVSGQAWRDLCEQLKSAGDLIVAHSTDDLDRIEGFRYLARLTRGGLQNFVENFDPAYNRILPIPHNLKVGCDNPDAYYQSVAIDPKYRYRLSGPRGTVNYLSIGAYSGGFTAGATTPGHQDTIEDNDPDPHGWVDIIASVDEPQRLEPGQRWLRLEPGSGTLIIRNFFLDRTNETRSVLEIECLNPPEPHPGPLTPKRLTFGFMMAGLYVHGVVGLFIDWLENNFNHRTNTIEFLPDDDAADQWGDPNQLFRHGSWRIGPDEAIVLTVPPIRAYYWNFQLNNMWEESLDYDNHQITVNAHTAHYEDDGSVKLVISPVDPGWGNWIDTAYHRHGTWGLRYNQVVEDLAPTVEVVRLADIGVETPAPFDSPADDKREEAISGRAWAEFCDSLAAAGEIILANSTTDLDRMEGFRYLGRLTRGALQSFLENRAGPFVRILPIPHNLKIGCDNPDAYYQNVSVDPAFDYRITGPRNTVNYLSIGAYSGGYAAGTAAPGRQGVITDNDPDPDGTIDIIASIDEPERLAPGQQWLRMEPSTTTIILRNFFLDRTTERRSDLQIECLNPPTPDPGPLTATQLVDGLAISSLFVHGVTQRFLGWVNDIFAERPNTLDYIPGGGDGWGDPNQKFRHGSWELADDEAMVITVPPIRAYYWNFQLNNRWEESLDYLYRQVTVNAHTARYEPDGSCRIVIAAEDPGWGNWMDTCERQFGTMGLRYNQVVEDLPPTVEIVKTTDLASMA